LFAANDAKTNDHFFTGFPSYWNIVALYLHVAALAPVWNAMILLVLARSFSGASGMSPSTPTLQATIGLGVCWGTSSWR
jgi:phosphatidylserine synthase